MYYQFETSYYSIKVLTTNTVARNPVIENNITYQLTLGHPGPQGHRLILACTGRSPELATQLSLYYDLDVIDAS